MSQHGGGSRQPAPARATPVADSAELRPVDPVPFLLRRVPSDQWATPPLGQQCHQYAFADTAASVADLPVAVATVAPHLRTAELLGIVLQPDLGAPPAGASLGVRLLQQLFDLLRRDGIERLSARVGEDDVSLLRLMRVAGFTPIPNPDASTGVNWFTMDL